MNDIATRRSPIDGRTPAAGVETLIACGMEVPKRFDSAEVEQKATQDLALCDLSLLPKWGVKGRGAAACLTASGINVPAENYQTGSLADGGLIVRLPGEEFLLEGGLQNEILPSVAKQATATDDVFSIERQDATILLLGERSQEVLAQTCGLNPEELVQGQAVMTRVAGVSCTLLPQQLDGTLAYRMWVDYSYAAYLWDTLIEICGELGGRVVGAAAVLSDLA